MGFSLRWKKRPDINEQNTGHMAFQRPTGVVKAGYAGMAGIRTGTLGATYPGTVVPGNSLVRRDAFVTGNVNENIKVESLTDPDDAVSRLRAYSNTL